MTIIVARACPAPNPSPIEIDKNRQASSNGSLIGVLKRTIDRAPTKPRDNASEDFTTLITKKTVIAITTNVLSIDCDLENVGKYLLQCSFNK